MAIVERDTVSVDVLTTMIESGFDAAVDGFRINAAADQIWTQFSMQIGAGGAAEVLQTWMESVRAMTRWDGEKKFQDMINRQYKVGQEPWHAGIRMRREDVRRRVNQMGAEAFAADIRDKLAERAAQLDIVKVLDQLTSPTRLGYDGVALFSATHPEGGNQSNQDTGGAGQYFYVMSLGGRGRPIVRIDGETDGGGFQIKDHVADDTTENFMQRLIYWSVEFWGEWYPGLWQTVYRSNQALTGANLDAAIQAMSSYHDIHGEQIGIVPTHILVGRSNWRPARELLGLSTVSGGGENVDSNLLKVLYTPRLP